MSTTKQPTVNDLIKLLQRVPQNAPLYRDDSEFRAVPLRGIIEDIAESTNFFTGEVMPRGVKIG